MNNDPLKLPDDVVLSVRGVSKKFCRNLKRSMWYGMQDLVRNLTGIRPERLRQETLDPRPETIDLGQGIIGRGLEAEGIDRMPDSPDQKSRVHGLKSNVSIGSGLPPLRKDEFWALQDISFDLKNCLLYTSPSPRD